MINRRTFILTSIFILLQGLFFNSSAQNIAVNGDFENYSVLPSGYGQYNACVGISDLNNNATFSWPYASPDYLHMNGSGGVQLPACTFGTVNPYNGDAVFGLCAWYAPNTPDFREYVSIPLSTPLIPGNQYQCTFYITNGTSNILGGGCDHMGVQFSIGTIPQVDHEPVGGVPQFEIPGPFTSTTWQQQTFTFTATTPCNQVCFGNFFDDASTTGIGGGAYYFIDMVEVIPLTQVFSISGDTSLCSGESTTLTAFNTSTCWWESLANPGVSIDQDSILTITPLVAATYVAHGDTATDSLTVYVHPVPVVNLGNDTTICGSFAMTLDAENTGNNYLWSTTDVSQTINVVQSGTYSVTVTTAFGCSASDAITITSVPFITVNLGNDSTLCDGNTVTINAGPVSYLYLWSTGETTNLLSTNSTGNYSVTVTNGTCVGNDTIQITFNTPPVFSIGNDTSLCIGQTYNITAPSGFNYLWNTGEITQTISVTTPNSYSVVLNDGYCTGTDIINVDFFDAHFVDIGPDLTMCQGDVTTITSVISSQQNLWSTGQTSTFISVSDSGIFWLEQTYQGCVSRDSLHISILQRPYIVLPDDIIFCGTNAIEVEGYTFSSTITWSTGDTTNPIFVNVFPAIIWASVTNGYCTSTDTIEISMDCDLFIPNAFSPNGDGINDEFKVMQTEIQQFIMQIYDRWGELVYETNNPNSGWDGKFNEMNCNIGAYVYYIKATLADSKTIERKGNVTLLR